MNILSHTHSEFSARFDKGKLIAGEIYRQWCKKGALFLDEPMLLQAKARTDEVIASTDFSLPEIERHLTEGDTQKFLLRLHDGYVVESVLIPMKTQNTLCISSQVGCKRACAFCETGRMGLLRNLTAHEIVSQVFVARFICKASIRNVVFMGMGEPFDNYDEVKKAIGILIDQNGLAFGNSRVTVSTSGNIEAILRLSLERDIQPNLAVSLNAPNDALRTKLMPHNRRESLSMLKEAITTYNARTSKEVLLAYVLIKGVNDDLALADELIGFIEGLSVKINIIPYNPQSVDKFQAPDNEVVDSFVAHLRDRQIPTLLRRTKGRSIMAGCGQLGNASKSSRKITINQDRMGV